MGKVALLILLGALPLSMDTAQETDNPQKAWQLAEESDMPLLLMFSGSDWCVGCIKFACEVPQWPAYDSLRQHFVTLKLDFTRKKQAFTPDVLNQREALSKKYNPLGRFPWFALVMPGDSQVVTSTGFTPGRMNDFLLWLQDGIEMTQR